MIGLPLTVFLTLLISLFFFFLRKHFTFIENSIVFMAFTIVSTNVMTILTLNLNWMKKTDHPLLFPAVLLYRDIIIPLLILIFINIFYTSFNWGKKTFSFIFIFTCLFGIEALLNFLGLFEFIKWNLLYAGIVNIGYILVGLGIARTVLFVSKRSLKQ